MEYNQHIDNWELTSSIRRQTHIPIEQMEKMFRRERIKCKSLQKTKETIVTFIVLFFYV